MKRTARLLAAACIAMATVARAGGPLGGCNDPAHTPIKYVGAGTITLNYDSGTLGSRTKLQADAIVSSAVSVWTNVSTASVTIGRGSDLPVDVNSANYLSYYNKFADGLFPVIYDSDGSIIDLLLGVGSKSSILGFAGSGFPVAGCFYTEGQAVINGFPNVSDTLLGTVIAHEVGHLIGMDHTQLDNVQGIASPGNYPLMYPILDRTSVSLHEDDAAAVSALYPDPTINTVYGEINGTFVLANGVTPVKGANLWASETTTHKAYSIISDFRKQGTGFFRLLLPAGTYTLHAGTLRTTFVGASGMGPYASSMADLSFQPPLYVSGVAMPNVTLGGNVSPTSFAISPGCVATLTFRLDGTGAVGGNCVVALTVAISGTGSGTVTSIPAGINCSPTCSASYGVGGSITLMAAPISGSFLESWAGCDSSSALNCTVTTLASARTLTAVFTAISAAPPDAPTNPAAIAGNGQATISFTTPANNGGATITTYTAACTAGGSTSTGSASASPVTVTGLINNTVYNCSVTATNAAGTGTASSVVSVTPSATATLTLTGVRSRKTHAGVDFDIPVTAPDINGLPTAVESRIIGAGHRIVYQFNNSVTSIGTVSATSGSVQSAILGNEVEVTLTAVADNSRATVTLAGASGVNGTVGTSAVIGFLVGDVNNTRSVNSSDISAVKARSGQTTNSNNFKFDVNISGSINSSDISAVKARSGLAIP